MVQRRDRARFALESLTESLRGNLRRHFTAKSRVSGFVDFAHAACTNPLDDFVRTQALAGGEIHSAGILHHLVPPKAVSDAATQADNAAGGQTTLWRYGQSLLQSWDPVHHHGQRWRQCRSGARRDHQKTFSIRRDVVLERDEGS